MEGHQSGAHQAINFLDGTSQSPLTLTQFLSQLFGRQVPRKPRPSGRGQGAQYERKVPYREAPAL